MNRRMVLSTIGKILKIESILLLLPLIVSVIYKENSIFSFLITSAVTFILGTLATLIAKPRTDVIYAREGFIIVSLAWLFMSLFGALPFVISGEIPSFVDAFFETISGFTTTGASILNNVEALGKATLFWRSFTHWIGGMGVLVFLMAFSKSLSGRSIHIMRAEVPGPVVGKIVPRVKDTAKILYFIYIALTFIQIIVLWCGEMNLYESIVHSFATAGTGGFGIKGDSVGGYSVYSQWVIAIFMLLFGVNFNLYYLALVKKIKTAIKSTELWVYIGIIVISSIVISLNIYSSFDSVSETIRTAFFQTSSIITTTGFSTVDFNLWPGMAKAVIVVLMFIGASAGSTGGGLKVSRVMILVKTIKREIKKLLHPRSVSSVSFEGKPLDETTINGVATYFVFYVMCIIFAFMLISFEPFGFECNFIAAVSCFNNIGPSFGIAGPAGSFAEYCDFSKIILSFAMLFGRLEIFPMFITILPSTWKRN